MTAIRHQADNWESKHRMAGNVTFLKAATTQAWLSQFDPSDQQTAKTILEEMLLVSRDEFAERLRSAILRRLDAESGPVGIYVERELPSRKGIPHRLFKESSRRPKRAHGIGPAPVEPTRRYDPDVGSEGIVAQLVTEICRERKGLAINHPGPDAIRKKSIRRFMLVTDFIGSGDRAWKYLQAAWRVRSVRSWWSLRASNGMGFEVVAYSGSLKGIKRVQSHPSAPLVSTVCACPTVSTSLSPADRQEATSLCERKNPDKKMPAMGFGEVGALIAFAHGAPNNCPAMLFKKASGWEPLFPVRLTTSTRADFTVEDAAEEVRARLEKMGQSRLAHPELKAIPSGKRSLLLIMAALSKPPRTPEAVSRKTRLTLFEVEAAMARGLKLGWLDGRNRVTDEGHAELRRARIVPAKKPAFPSVPEEPYYPKSLRAPT
jgi:hypothetical protein